MKAAARTQVMSPAPWTAARKDARTAGRVLM
jgi:hypothetical protein